MPLARPAQHLKPSRITSQSKPESSIALISPKIFLNRKNNYEVQLFIFYQMPSPNGL